MSLFCSSSRRAPSAKRASRATSTTDEPWTMAGLDGRWITPELLEQGGASAVTFCVQLNGHKSTVQSWSSPDVIECGLLGGDRMQLLSRRGVLVCRAPPTHSLCCTIRTRSPSDFVSVMLLTVAPCSRLDQRSVSAYMVPLGRPLILDGFRHARTLTADSPQTWMVWSLVRGSGLVGTTEAYSWTDHRVAGLACTGVKRR